MKVVSVVVLLSILCNFAHGQGELKVVVAVFRHGDKTVDKNSSYPKNPYANLTYSPYGHGELTNQGRQRAYQLGKTLRKMYNKHLHKVNVKAISTDYNRTINSLNLVLTGLFDRSKNFNLSQFNLDIAPVRSNRLLSFPIIFCPHYQQLHKQYLDSEVGRTIIGKYVAGFPYIHRHTGANITNIIDLLPIYECIKGYKEWGLISPMWTNRVGNYLVSAVEDFFVSLVASPDLNKLYGGILLKEILRNMDMSINALKSKELYLYSAHDLNVVGLLGAMELYWRHIPSYTACIVMELHEIDHVHYVKVLYQEKTARGFKEMSLPNCNVLCPLNTLKKNVHKNIPDEIGNC